MLRDSSVVYRTCTFQYPSDNLICFTSGGRGFVHAFHVIDSSTAFITIDSDVYKRFEVRKITLDSTAITNQWMAHTVWTSVCASLQDKLTLSPSSDILYAFINIDYILFVVGDIIQSVSLERGVHNNLSNIIIINNTHLLILKYLFYNKRLIV